MKQDIEGTQCVYTIINMNVIDKANKGDGSGEFDEGSRWVSAAKYFETLGPDDVYPLLMANAASIIGVQWIAKVDSIELLGKGTRVKFSGMYNLDDSISLDNLVRASDGEPLSTSYIRPYVPCFVQGELESDVMGLFDDVALTDLDVIDSKSADDYFEALREIEATITDNQKAMLIAHAEAPAHVFSTRQMADVAGYQSHGMANIQYGKLGRMFAECFDAVNLQFLTQSMASGSPVKNQQGHFTWTLRQPLVEALYRFGWVAKPLGVPVDFTMLAAEMEVAADPKCKGIPETTRVALVEARVGQGGYRARLLDVWGGQCAVTGCNVGNVLIASHAKPWKTSSNEERLDEYNGLLLTANVDKLFDSGLISFRDDGGILLKPELTKESLSQLGISHDSKMRFVDARHQPYLAAHRAQSGFM